jgi:predicted ATPase
MVGELAPLDLWMQRLLRPGDWLIIDEPEAHLHPENQRLIAQVLVRLVRASVRVICPTHSSTILHQVSNHILAARLDPDVREAAGLTEDDFIHPDEVAVYLFQPKRDGAHVEPVEVNPEWGISEDEFIRVGEVMGKESYRLTVAGMDLEPVHVGS